MNQIEDIGNLGSENMMYKLITIFSNEILNQYGDVIIIEIHNMTRHFQVMSGHDSDTIQTYPTYKKIRPVEQ